MALKKTLSDTHKQRIAASMTGKRRTPEQRARIAEGRRKYCEKVKAALANYEATTN